MHAPKGSVTFWSWPVELLSGEVYFDLFDMLKDKDWQFSCTDKNMIIDSRSAATKPQTKPHGKVYHCSPCETPRKQRHLTCFRMKSYGFRVAFFLCLLVWLSVPICWLRSWLLFVVFAALEQLDFCGPFIPPLLLLPLHRLLFLQVSLNLYPTRNHPHSLGFTPRSFLLFQHPLPFLFTSTLYTIKDYWFPLLIPFPLHTGISISTQSRRLTCRHKELALRLSKWS